MTTSKEEIIIDEMIKNIDVSEIDNKYDKIYTNITSNLKIFFSYYHQRLNILFDAMNDRAKGSKYYLADYSRELIKINKDLDDYKQLLEKSEFSFKLNENYENHLKYCLTFLKQYYGSEIPEDYKEIKLIKYEPIFYIGSYLKKNEKILIKNIKIVGSGAYADVFKYKDDFYNMNFAYKRLKKGYTDKELMRFRKEYEFLNKLNHPNILKAHHYNEDENAYIMDYCDFTLNKYYELFNGNDEILNFKKKKEIALQFLETISFLHSKGVLHRDISYNNILIKKYDNDLIQVKISDFGLIKDEDSELTSTGSDIKGTIRDDTLEKFSDYNIKNEIYVIGVMLFFIFTGKKNLLLNNDILSNIVKKCIDRNHDNRFNNVDEIKDEIINLKDLNSKVTSLNYSLKDDVIDKTGLNDLAKQLLYKSVNSDGIILKLRTLSGLTIQCGNEAFEPNNPKEEANLEYAIELLNKNAYIKNTDYKGEVFKVTKKGFDLFD